MSRDDRRHFRLNAYLIPYKHHAAEDPLPPLTLMSIGGDRAFLALKQSKKLEVS